MGSQSIFITGATGFIGAHVADQSLKAGYRVRLSVRKQEQIEDLKQRYAAHASALEFAVVPDITAPRAFEGHLDGITHVFHLASPIPVPGKEDIRRDFVDPAVKGTTSILETAAAKPDIQTVIITSSVVSLLPIDFPTEVHVKDNTGEAITADIDALSEAHLKDPMVKYRVSKILAHEYTKKFLAERKPHFKILTFHPVVVLGHSISQKNAEGIEGMNAVWWATLQAEQSAAPPSWVAVQDVAIAHIKALEADVPTGTELLLSGEPVEWDRILRFLRAKYPTLAINLRPPFSTPWDVSTATAEKYLGIKWTSHEETVAAIVDQQLAFRSS